MLVCGEGRLRQRLRRAKAGMAELVDATDSKPVAVRHESSILSPGTDTHRVIVLGL